MRTAPVTPQVMAAYDAPSSHPRWWWGVTATASVLAVAGIVGLFPVTPRIVTERSPGGVVPFTRSLLVRRLLEIPPKCAVALGKSGSLPFSSSISLEGA